MLGEMSNVGTKSTVATGVTVTVNMIAKQFEFQPNTITVNQGDTLVINLSVPSNDPAPVAHGLLMETYLENGINVNKGQTKQITSNATVTFGGVAAASVSVTSSTSIVAVTPPAASAGAVPIVVKNGDGQSGSFSSFTYTLPAPSINSVSPAAGPTSGGTTFTISGNGFVSGATVTVG